MITIGTKLRPFSHATLAKCVLPGTDLVVEVAPDFVKVGPWELRLQGERPVTLQQDLEKQCVRVFGKSFFFTFRLSHEGVFFRNGKGKEEKILDSSRAKASPSCKERLSLGSEKRQDWDLVLRRFDLKEILPPLYCLSQLDCPTLQKAPLTPKGDLELWMHQTFHHLLVPQENRSVWQEAFSKIRSLFIQEEEGKLFLLPSQMFPEGRFLHAQIFCGRVDFEWTKWRLRKMVVHGEREGEIHLPQFVSCRVRKSLHERGKVHFWQSPLAICSGEKLFLDRFQA